MVGFCLHGHCSDVVSIIAATGTRVHKIREKGHTVKRVVVGNKFLYESVTARAGVLIARCRSEVKRPSLLLLLLHALLSRFPSLT